MPKVVKAFSYLAFIFGISVYEVHASRLPSLPCRSIIENLSLKQTLDLLGSRLTEEAPRVFALRFKRSFTGRVTWAFMRPQESYEGPYFQNRIFTMKAFQSWYRRNVGRNHRFTYLSDWGGFNIPSKILKPFQTGEFGPLSRNESLLVRLANHLGENFYLIAIRSNDESGLRHELAHGLWATHPDYRLKVQKVLKDFDRKSITRKLRKTGGYHESVIEDEIHAYLVDGYEFLYSPRARPQILKKIEPYRSALRRILDDYRN